MYEGMPVRRHYRGHSLISLAALLVLVASTFMTAFAPARSIAIGASEVADLSNAARVQNGLPAFNYNGQLAAAAQAKAEHMKANNYFEHTAPDGTTGWYFIGLQGYSYITAGENLAATNENASAVVNGWMNSPGHRANLLNGSFTEVGYGVVFMGQYLQYQGIYFVVALYGQPTQQVVVQQATPTPPPAQTPAPQSVPVVPAEEMSAEPATPTQEQPKDVSEENIETTAAVNPSSTPPNESASGTLAVTSPSPFINISPAITNAILAIGVIMLGVGVFLELRHFMHHPTLNHHHPKAH